MQSAGISQLPVLEDGKPVGSIQEVTLARVLHDDRDPDTVKVGEIMARPLPQLDVTAHLDEAYRLLLAGNTGVLAVSDGKDCGHRDTHRPDSILGHDATQERGSNEIVTRSQEMRDAAPRPFP